MSLLIRNGYVVTMNGRREVFPGGFVQTNEQGAIVAAGAAADCPPDFDGEVFDASGMIVLPGLVNARQQHWQHLLMGHPADGPALRQCRAALHTEDLRLAAQLAAGEMLCGGTTTVFNHTPPGCDDAGLLASIEPMLQAGLRQVVAIDQPWSQDHAGERQVQNWHGAHGGLVHLAVQVTVDAQSVAAGLADEATMRQAWLFARTHGLRLSAQTSDAQPEAIPWAQAVHSTGRSTVMHLMELGLLDSSWVLGRAEHLGDADRALIRESGCHVVATPLADASCGMSSTAWTAMAQAGVPCALGTDGPVASCSVDMVEQMKALVLIQNTLRLDPTSMSVEAVLEMATLGGARALGLERDIGSLEPGKRADIAVFDMNGPHLQVAHKPTSIFVCCARGADAALVVVNGRVAWRAPGEPATPADQALVAAAR